MEDDPSARPWFHVANAEDITSPALLIYPERIDHNIRAMINQVGGEVNRLRPHVKTYKMAEVVKMLMAMGIDRFKCATIAEAEMTARAGGRDVLLSYQPVGPNIGRMASLIEAFPGTSFAAVVDDAGIVDQIADAFTRRGLELRLLVDIDCGMGRTGIAPGEGALSLCRQIIDRDSVRFEGLHIYDGHIHEASTDARGQRFEASQQTVEPLLADLKTAGIDLPLIVGGGSPTFPWHAKVAAKWGHHYECSPGTTLLWDAGYGTNHPDLDFEVAALLMTRVLSKPGKDRLCLELGHKAVAAENPIERRVQFPEFPDAKPLMQSEEHLVLETSRAGMMEVGDVVYGIPWHICPTVALHQEGVVVREGRFTGERWTVEARDRRLSI